MSQLRFLPLSLPLLLLFLLLHPSPAAAQDPLSSSCDNGNLIGFIEEDTTLGGELFMTSSVTVRNEAILTLEPGTTVTVCGDYRLWVQAAVLIAEGTAEEPIVFDSADPAAKWQRIELGAGGTPIGPSRFRYVTVNNGGGSDASADIGAIYISGSAGVIDGGPLLDHVTVTNSGSYGIYVRTPSGEKNAITLTNLTVNGSANEPLMLYAAGMGGLGTGHSFADNDEDVIEVRGCTACLGGQVQYHQRWRKQTVPYKIVEQLRVRTVDGGGDDHPILTLEAGVTLLMGEGTRIWSSRGGIVTNGTAAEPVTITNAPGETWSHILIDDRFGEPHTSFTWTSISNASSENGAIQQSDGILNVQNTAIRNSTGPAIAVADGFLQMRNSAVEENDVGLLFRVGSNGVIRSSVIQNNTNGGIVNDDSRGTCIDAAGNYWGEDSGPADASSEDDDCGNGLNNDGSGSVVTDNVIYRPWLTASNAERLDNISANNYWVIADGIQTTDIVLTLRGEEGVPLVGKEVEVSTTLGEVSQPTMSTDADGTVRAQIRSSKAGRATISAVNKTDELPLESIANITFWQGDDADGLIDPIGAPYETPQLIIEGKPFEKGIPIVLRMPMQNSQSQDVDVKVTYGATKLNIGQLFTPVAEVTKTLAPGEQWDALASYTPTIVGHQCVEAVIEGTTSTGEVVTSFVPNAGGTRRQQNLDFAPPDDSCDPNQVYKLIPTSPGLGGVRKHFKNGRKVAGKGSKCIGRIGSQAASASSLMNDERDYATVATPPTYAGVPLAAGGDVTEAEATAATAVSQAAAQVGALSEVIAITTQRVQWAGQAGDAAAVRRQLAALNGYRTERANAQEAYAKAIDDLLAATKGAGKPDTLFVQADYNAHLAALRTSGYDAETKQHLLDSGLSETDIQELLDEEVTLLADASVGPTSFYELLERNRDDVAVKAATIFECPLPRDAAELEVFFQPVTMEFEVGNPTESEATVNLDVTPQSLPLGWSYSVTNPAPTLGPGESTTIGLILFPGDQFTPGAPIFPGLPLVASGAEAIKRGAVRDAIREQNNPILVEGIMPRLAVEGHIGDELIGGIIFETGIPVLEDDGTQSLYLPLITRQ